MAAMGQAKFDFGGGQTTDKPWEEFKLPKTTVQLNFHNAGVDNVLALYQKLSGVTIVKDPALTGQITITSAKSVPLKDAFNILSTTLKLKGFDMEKDGSLLVIKQRKAAPAGGAPNIAATGFTPDSNPFTGGGDRSADQPKLKVYPIQYANASQVARVINEVFQNVADQSNPFARFGGANIQFRGGRGRGGGNQFQGGGGAANFLRALSSQQSQSNVRASSDDFSNSVIVNAPDRDQEQVATLIKELDKQTDEPEKSKVFHLEYAAASDIAPVVQNVLVSNAPRGRGGIGAQNVPVDQRFQQALRFGSSQAAFGQVVADQRTNSLVVTATPENLDTIGKVIQELDQPVAYQSSTFVFPLNNAKADEIATLLNQAFGSRQGTGINSNFNRGNASTANRNNTNTRNSNNRNNGRPGGLGGNTGFSVPNGAASPTDQPSSQDQKDKDLEVALQDPNASAGDLLTSIGVTQGFPFGGFFGGQRGGANNSQQSSTGRDSQGRLINVRDLTGQVTAVPDLNTNSIIVVASPEDADLIRNILSQLDKIPEQVMIETVIAEATLSAEDKLGVEWKFIQSSPFKTPGSTGTAASDFGLQSANPALQGFRYTLAGASLNAFLNALKTDSKFQVLSTPRIFTSNNSPAEINISQSVPYVLSSREDANGNLTFNYAFQDVGIVLQVTPRITANGYVTMDVTQTANDLQGFTTFNAPIVNQRQANTTVSVKDGETIILGGIIRSTVSTTTNKIPLLGDLPILGTLFRSTDKTKQKTELMVFLTPHIVRDAGDAKDVRDTSIKQLSPETQKSLSGAPVNPPFKTGAGKGNGG